jgi:hypothetical protein
MRGWLGAAGPSRDCGPAAPVTRGRPAPNVFDERKGASSRLITVVCATVLALFSGCASTSPNALPKYQPPPLGAPAAVIDAGHGHAWSVDGAETPPFAKTVRLTPGEHRVGLNCLSFEIVGLQVLPGVWHLPTMAAVDIAYGVQFVLATGSFEQGRTYYVRCVATSGQPRVWLSDASDGGDLPPGFTVLCTRSCPP